MRTIIITHDEDADKASAQEWIRAPHLSFFLPTGGLPMFTTIQESPRMATTPGDCYNCCNLLIGKGLFECFMHSFGPFQPA